MKFWNVDLMSGERVEETLRTRENVEAETAADAIRDVTVGEIGHEWPISSGDYGATAEEPDGIRYWLATEAAPAE